MHATNIELPRDAIAAFCQRHAITRLALFGSVIRDDFDLESDIDVLVEFAPGYTPGLAFFDMQNELTELLGRQTDLNTSGWISPFFRDEVLAEAQVIYEQA